MKKWRAEEGSDMRDLELKREAQDKTLEARKTRAAPSTRCEV